MILFPTKSLLVEIKREYHHQNHHNWREQVVMPLAPRDDCRNC
jgi:hypothetical protein